MMTKEENPRRKKNTTPNKQKVLNSHTGSFHRCWCIS